MARFQRSLITLGTTALAGRIGAAEFAQTPRCT